MNTRKHLLLTMLLLSLHAVSGKEFGSGYWLNSLVSNVSNMATNLWYGESKPEILIEEQPKMDGILGSKGEFTVTTDEPSDSDSDLDYFDAREEPTEEELARYENLVKLFKECSFSKHGFINVADDEKIDDEIPNEFSRNAVKTASNFPGLLPRNNKELDVLEGWLVDALLAAFPSLKGRNIQKEDAIMLLLIAANAQRRLTDNIKDLMEELKKYNGGALSEDLFNLDAKNFEVKAMKIMKEKDLKYTKNFVFEFGTEKTETDAAEIETSGKVFEDDDFLEYPHQFDENFTYTHEDIAKEELKTDLQQPTLSTEEKEKRENRMAALKKLAFKDRVKKLAVKGRDKITLNDLTKIYNDDKSENVAMTNNPMKAKVVESVQKNVNEDKASMQNTIKLHGKTSVKKFDPKFSAMKARALKKKENELDKEKI